MDIEELRKQIIVLVQKENKELILNRIRISLILSANKEGESD